MSEHIASQVHKILIKKKKSVSIAESCTGGLVSSFLTDIPGSSQYLILGVVAYSNKAKEKILGIPAAVIREKGAVSGEVALRMASAAKRLGNSDFGLGITGIAGPTGGSRTKPAGTVFIALAGRKKRIFKKYFFKGGRREVRRMAAGKALELLYTTVRR